MAISSLGQKRKIQTSKVPLLMESEHVIDITNSNEASSSRSTIARPVNGSNSSQNEDLPSTNAQAPISFPITDGLNSRNTSFARRGNGNGRRRSPLSSGYWISVELVITVSQIIAAVVVLSLSRHEHPHAPLFTWVIGYASGCVVTLPLLFWRFYNRNASNQEPQARQSSSSTSLSAIASSFTSSSNGRSSEGDTHSTNGTLTRRLTMASLSARMKVLAEYLKMGLDCFFAVWFVVGNVWIFGGHSSSSDAPNLYRLCIVFLTFSCIGYAMPLILCTTICCCLPCIISVLGFREDLAQNRGATTESINSLPTYKFKKNKNKNDKETNSDACDGGVVAVELSRVSGSAPQLITIGADKTLAIWDTMSFKELRRIKPVPKMACHSVASWCHPRAPNLDILTCVKDSHIWAIEHPTYSALTRPLCELSSLVPPQVLAPHKKLRVYSMVAHPLQPHIVATGTNIGIILSEFDPRSLPAVAPLPSIPESREHSAVYVVERELKLLQFQLNNTANPSLGSNGSLTETGRLRGEFTEQLNVKQMKKHISTPVPHDSYSVLSVSSSGKYLAIVWPDIPYFSIYKVSDWSIVDSGTARLLAWDTCRDRFALLESAPPPRMPILPKTSSSKKAKEAAAIAAAQAAAAAASAASVQVRILLDDGTSNILMRSIGQRTEPVIGLHGGTLLGISYRTSRRVSPVAATSISSIQSMPLSGFGSSGVSSFSTIDDPFASQKNSAEPPPHNFQLYSWESFQPVGGMLPQPEWTVWDQTVEYCAFAYPQYIAISSLRPQYRYLGDVAIPHATGAVWHRRQLFVVTPTTIECVFVDAGVAPIDIETKRRKEEMKQKEAQARAVAEHGELALIAVDTPQSVAQEKISLRPPMLQVVRLASFQHPPSIPPFLTLPKQTRSDADDALQKFAEGKRVDEIAVGGGGVAVAVTRFPSEQKRPIGPLVLVGVRDGVLWLIDRYMFAHAISLSHPGIRCRCLAAYGDAVSAVKWASRLGREHHDDLAQFLLGMGYATEALHLPGISKRLEFDLAMKSSDLKRALQCLLTMSNSRNIGQDTVGLNLNDIMSLSTTTNNTKKEAIVDAVDGVVKFAQEFLDVIDAADATGQAEVAREALKRLAAAGAVKGALQGHQLRGLALRLANHGELTRLGGLVNNLISVGFGREAAFAAAVLGDNTLMEKSWQDTGMLAEAVLHAHAHGRTTLRTLVQAWNKTLQKEMEHGPSTKTDAASAFLASLEEPKLTSLADAAKKPPIEILPPGMPSIDAPLPGIQKKTMPTLQGSLPQPPKPLQLEGPPSDSPPTAELGAVPPAESGAPPPAAESEAPPSTAESEVPSPAGDSEVAPPAAESGATVPPTAESEASPTEATPESGATPSLDSGSGVATAESSAPGVPSESQTPVNVNIADPVSVTNDGSLNSLNSTPPPTVAPTQKPQVPSGVREELPMIDWT